MCPASVGTSRASRALETGEAKLWVLLVGVNQYNDEQLPNLSYSALDCQGLGEAIAVATQAFPQRSVVIHHDFAGPSVGIEDTREFAQGRSLSTQVAAASRLSLETHAKLRCFPAQPPERAQVWHSLQQMVSHASAQDTILFYFSGHGVLAPDNQQAVLCLADTHKSDLLNTGLGVQDVLQYLSQSAARQQIVWLDACHSGGMTFRGGRGDEPSPELPNPTLQLVDLLRRRAAQSNGFYALLSCDQTQQSWEFPELGHGVFTYYLMRGLLGEAADAQGVIEADALYKYVYYQTLRYIDKTNQQLRLINQQKRGRGETQLQPEYPLQTPKRIVEGIGELILGITPTVNTPHYPRQALVVEGLVSNPATLSLCKLLRGAGGFQLSYVPQPGKEWTGVREAIQTCLQSVDRSPPHLIPDTETALLYLRGRTLQTETGEAQLVLKDGVDISRSWLRQELRRSPIAHQVLILDCPEAIDLAEWVEDLQLGTGRGQCLIAVASPEHDSDWFAGVLLATLAAADPQVGLPIAGWIAQIQASCAEVGITPHVWLSGTQGVIEVLPGTVGSRGEDGFDLGLCPYMGLRAFTEDDAPFFFGREPLTQQLVNQVRQRSLLAVVGASGSGKSSVVQAGLVAQLRQGKQLPGSEQWWIRCFRPGHRPLDALIQRLVDGGTESERKYQQLQLEGLLYQGVEGWVHWLRSRPEPMVVLVVDQFEELFTLAPAEDQHRFLELILGGLEHADDRFKLILTLRTDFIAPCLDYPALARELQQSSVLVPPRLNEDDYRQVITKPAEKVGLKVDPELVEVLLQELSHLAGDLPLLEFVLEQLWEHRQPGELSLAVYQQQIGGLRGALERKAQAIYDSLDSEAQACARWIFLALTQLGDGTEDTRRRVCKSDLVVAKYPLELVERTLQALTAAKLVIVSGHEEPEQPQEGDRRSKGTREAEEPKSVPIPDAEVDTLLPLRQQDVTVEVAHEILIRHWSTLRWWLEENRARLRSQRQIEHAAIQWKQSGQQSDFLLRGVRLDAAAELYVKYTDELSPDMQQFIEAGLHQRDREQQQAKRRLKQAQRAIALIGTLGLAAATFAGLAYLQRQQAQLSEIEALNALSEAQLLSNQSLDALVTSVKASRQLQQMSGFGVGATRLTAIQTQTVGTLQQAVENAHESNRLEGHSQAVNSVSVSLDGQWLASGSDDATVRLWKPDGTLVKQLDMPDRVTAVGFSPNGSLLAVASADGSVQLGNPLDDRLQFTLQHNDWATAIAFTPTSQLVATASRDRTVKLWNTTNGQLIRTLNHGSWVNGVSMSANGQLLATAGEDGIIKLWNVATGALIRTLVGHGDRANSVAFSPTGETLVSASDDRSVRVWNIVTGTSEILKREFADQASHGDRVTSVTFSPDGRMLASTSADGIVQLWSSTNWATLETLNSGGSAILSAAFSPDSHMLISAGADKRVRLWQVQPVVTPPMPASTASFNPSGNGFAVAGWDGTIQRWQRNQTDLPQLAQTIQGSTLPIASLRFSPDGKWLASAGDDQTITLWDAANGTPLHTLIKHQDSITSLSFSPDETLLASGSGDRTIRLWNLADHRLLTTLTGHQDGITSVVFSPKGNLLASGSHDATIKLWKQDGTMQRSLTGHSLSIAALSFSPDGKTLASASWDNTIKLWRVNDGTLIQTLSGHQDGVTSLDFSPNSKVLASGSADRTVKLWNASNGKLLKTLYGHSNTVLSLNFSPDNKALLSTSETSGALVWNLDLDDLIEHGCDRLHDYLKTSETLEESDRSICR